MALLVNDARTVALTLHLLRTERLEIDPDRPSTENWVPFTLSLSVEGQERHRYSEADGATLTLFEVERLISAMAQIYHDRVAGIPITELTFYALEAYFELIVRDNLEPDSVEVEIWFNMGALTRGERHGYDLGCRFNVELEVLAAFTKDLGEELRSLLVTDTHT